MAFVVDKDKGWELIGERSCALSRGKMLLTSFVPDGALLL